MKYTTFCFRFEISVLNEKHLINVIKMYFLQIIHFKNMHFFVFISLFFYYLLIVANCKRNLPLMCDKPMTVPRLAVDEELLLLRKALPIWAKKGPITHAIENNPVVIITAETGSGKTTQVLTIISIT